MISQFISGANAFGVEIELVKKDVDIAEICHAADFNESWNWFKKDSHHLVRLRHSVYILGRKHSRLRHLESVTFSCDRRHPASRSGVCVCGAIVKKYSQRRNEKRTVPQYKDVPDGSWNRYGINGCWNFSGIIDEGWNCRLIKVRPPLMEPFFPFDSTIPAQYNGVVLEREDKREPHVRVEEGSVIIVADPRPRELLL